MAQGDNKTGTKGKQCIFVMSHDEIAQIPKDRVVTYARIVVDFRPQKDDLNRVRMTLGATLSSVQAISPREQQILQPRRCYGIVC